MENSLDMEHKNVIDELTLGRELAKQLQIHLNAPSSSHEARELLVHKILNSYDKVLTMLKWNGSLPMGEPQPTTGATVVRTDSPRSFSGSPKSEDSDRDLKDLEVRAECKKRKSVPRWTQQVQICPGTGLEGPLEDGYSWRKYGQKDILGAKYPRGYYRCTHRHVQGCLATKQVQRLDEDPTIFEITYRGRHTCNNGPQVAPFPPSASPEKGEPSTALNYQQQMTQPPQSPEILLNFKAGLKVATEDLENQSHNFPPDFHFPSTSYAGGENRFTSPPFSAENDFTGNYFPAPFTSPATSDLKYPSVPPTRMAGSGEALNFSGLDSELMEIVSAATSCTNSPTVGLELPFGPDEDPFEPSFSFDNPRPYF